VVCAGDALAARAASVTTVELHVPAGPTGVRTMLRAIRIHQWVKNVLVFLPLIPLLSVLPWTAWLSGLVGFVCFGLCASSVYLVNDLLDLDADRAHERKRHRPIPSGELPLLTAILLALALLALAFVIAVWLLPPLFISVLFGYWLLTNAYSLGLKRRANIDVVALAVLYAMRLLAGSAIIMIKPSFWILTFSVFFFFSLAAAKRMVELDNLKKRQVPGTVAGRGYIIDDIAVLLAQGVASGQIAVLVFALYINDPATITFHHPEALWGICPLMLLWINRVWLKVNRGELHDDPVVFALRDGFSQVAVALVAGCVAIAV
jgi:4-hydroxybenzoate polyprenyltransferase